jgi:hypothetical protein
MRTNRINTTPIVTTPLAAAFAKVTGFDSIADATVGLSKYKEAEEKRREERRDEHQKGHQKRITLLLAFLLLGLFLAGELLKGRLHPLLKKLPPGVLKTFLKGMEISDCEFTDIPSLPFPSDSVRRTAAALSDDEKQQVEELLAKIEAPLSNPRNGKAKEPSWKNPPALIIVDHTFLTPEEKVEGAKRLADRIQKRVQRLGITIPSLDGDDTTEDSMESDAYVARITAVSGDLAKAMVTLSQLLVSGAISTEVYLSYLREVPVVPPDLIRILFRSKIQWRENA